jgi:hypothetical protein
MRRGLLIEQRIAHGCWIARPFLAFETLSLFESAKKKVLALFEMYRKTA